ncbi:MAG: EAL domain-containing protein, partial [Campylobacterales bacterium]|nr:EAL domain-containing protein [Campylobacterales bacterium]
TSNGEEKYLWVSKGPLKDSQGNVYGLFGISRDITDRARYDRTIAETNEKLDRLAHTDPLTFLPNRLSLDEYLSRQFSTSAPLPFSLIFFDLDGFQEINDSYGHRFGDELLVEFSHLLREVFSDETDYIVRTGGDEFVVVVPSVDQSVITFSLNRLIEGLRHPFSIEGVQVYTSASIGIANHPHDAQNAEELLRYADAAMYQAKKKGKNTYRFYDPVYTHQAMVRTTVSANLKKALKEGGLYLKYQPQIDPRTHAAIGYEALLRWNSPDGDIPPSTFIPICEESGLILQIGEYVLREGFLQALRWSRSGQLKGHIAINVSARQLIHSHFISTLETIVEETGCDPRWIELEITESSILENPEKTIATLGVVKSMGFKISIDDFGTGYSSLSYLKNLPVDKLKIDISFIRNISYEPKNQTIVKTIISLAKGLNLEALAEGVETKEELDFLVANGIDTVQGYYFYRPLDSREIEKIAM